MRRPRWKTMRRGVNVLLSAALTLPIFSVRVDAGDIQVREVVQGSADVSQSGSQTVINAANNTIVNYTRFNVGTGKGVTFVQPSEQARILNRVISSDPSYLLGSIQANGQVYFVNPSGVVIGENAVINAGQFIAAAGNITNSDFLNGIDRFTTVGGLLENNGNIVAGNGVLLVGDRVLNTGRIVSENGLVAMCSGKEVYLAETDSGVKIRVDNLDATTGVGSLASSGTSVAGVLNQGTVEGAEVVFSCGDVYSLAVVNSGHVRSRGGSVTLSGNGEVINSGQIDVSDLSVGNTGGDVKMLGETVAVQNGLIDASGSAGGGQILLGGNYQGAGQERNSSLTFVNANSRIVADATDTGDGGRVILWSNGRTGFFGELSAQGVDDGVGGFAEISGLEYLGLSGEISLGGPKGPGTLLLDPTNIIVATGGAANYEDVSTFGAAPGTDQTIDPATLDNVGADIALQATEDITITNALTLNTLPDEGETTDLTMRAGDDIIVNAPVTTSGGTMTLTANDNLGGASGTGSITVNSGLSTTGNGQTGANITLNVDGGTGTVDLNAPLDVGTTGSVLTGVAETVRVMSNAGSIQDALDTVAVGGTVKVRGAGTYTETVSITKEVSLLGVEADGTTEAWTTGTAGASATGPTISSTSETIISIDADDVTVAGLNIDTTNGNSHKGVSVVGSSDSLSVEYCSFSYDDTVEGDFNGDLAITFNPNLNDLVFDAASINYNVFNANGGTESWAILVGNATELAITNNTFDTGIKFSVGGGGSVTSDVLVSANTFNDYASPGIKFIRDGSGSIGEDFLIEQNDFNSRSIGIYFFATSDTESPDPDADYSLTAGNFSDTVTITENKFHSFAAGTEYALQVSEDDTELAINIDATVNFWDSVNGPTFEGNTLNVGFQGAEILNEGSANISISPWWDTLTNDVVGAYAGTLLVTVENITTEVSYTSFAAAIAAASSGDELQAVAGTYAEAVVVDKDLTIYGIGNEDEFSIATSWTSNVGTSIGLGGNLATTGGNFTFNGDVTLAADVILDSAGGDILFSALSGGGFDMTLTADVGVGTVTFGGVVVDLGSGVGPALTVEDGLTGLVTFSESLSTRSGLLVEGEDSQIRFNGVTALGDGNTGTTIEGDLIIGGGCSSLSSHDGLTVVGSTTVEAGTASLRLNGNASNMTFEEFDAGDRDLIIGSGTGAGDVTFAGAVSNLGDGFGEALNIEAGVTGTVWFQDVVSAGSGLYSGTNTNVRFDGDVTIAGDTIGTTLTGSVYLDGMTFTTDGELVLGDNATSDNLSLGGTAVVIDVTDQDVTIEAAVDGTGSLTILAGTGSVALDGAIGAAVSPSNLTVTAAEITTSKSVEVGNDLSLTASTGNLMLDGSVTANGEAELQAPNGAVIQTSGTVTASTVNIDSANGVYGQLDLEALGLESDPPTGYDNLAFLIASAEVYVDVTGTGKINIENSYTGNTTINSLTTQGGYINYTNTQDGRLTVSGAVTSGVVGVVDGGNISIVAAGLIILDAAVDSSDGAGGTITVADGVTVNVAPTAGAGDVLIAGSGDDGNDLYVNTAMVRGSNINLTSVRDIYIRSDVVTLEGYNISMTADSNNDGEGGVVVYSMGYVESGGTLTIVGSDVYLTAAIVDAIVIEGDAAAVQLSALGDIVLATSDVASEDAVIQVAGAIECTEEGGIGIYTAGGAIELDGSAVPDTYLLSAASGIYLASPVTLMGNTALNSVYLGDETNVADGSIFFAGTVDGTFDLTLAAGDGDIIFYKDVGATSVLGAVTITSANSLSVPARELEPGEDPDDFDDYDEEAETVGTTFTCESITHLNGGGVVMFSGDVSTKGQAGQAGGDILIATTEDIVFYGDIDASGGDAVAGAGLDGGTVSLVSASRGVVVQGVVTSGSDAVAGQGGDAGDVTLQPDTALALLGLVEGDYLPNAVLVVNGDIMAVGGAGAAGGADGAGGHVALSPAGRSEVSAGATIMNDRTGGDVTISAGSIEMGQNEKFTVLATDSQADEVFAGDLTLLTDNGAIVIGDLSAAGDLTINPGTGIITMLLRDPGTILLPNGLFTTDSALDVVCGGTMDITGTIVYGGVGGNAPLFAATAYTQEVLAAGSTQLIWPGPMQALTYDVYVLDGIATGSAGAPAIDVYAFVETMPGMPDGGAFPLVARQWARLLFKSLDANWDGALDYDEFYRYFGGSRDWFSAMDEDDDGKLDREEFEALSY